MPLEFELRCRNLVESLGLGEAAEVTGVYPLTGGVASDIARVDVGGTSYCVKFALEKLKVAEDWRAPVHRNKAEYAWLEAVSRIAPQSVPKLHGRSDIENGFAMEFLDSTQSILWKENLLHGEPNIEHAAAVGALLGKSHATTSTSQFDRQAFTNRDDFQSLRLDPYLNFTATRHPDLSRYLKGQVNSLYACEQVLVHGDVSPKNILLRGDTPILLDAECATMGDACFDLAFCMNHFLLKAIHRPDHQAVLLAAVGALWEAYVPHIVWEDAASVEARTTVLLPMLMLARVDGKSPVEYLNIPAQEAVRQLAIPAIVSPGSRLDHLISRFRERLST
jgi:aminoglycoside phosphotransferase (APT) family kinase protein